MTEPKMPDVLEDLHLLTIIAQARSLTQAARRLGISKASVSERLKDLERTVGMPLVRRTTRTTALTVQAKQLVDDMQSSFNRIEESFHRIRDLAGSPRGLIRVTAPVALGRQRICPAIASFLAKYPEIRLELDLNDRLVDLANEGFDIAIRHAMSAPPKYVAKVLASSRSLLVASRSYLQAKGSPEHPNDLARHACLLYLREGQAQSWTFQRRGSRRHEDRVSVPVVGPYKANNSEALRSAIQGGAGIGLLPDFSFEAQSASDLIEVLPEWHPIGFFGNRIFALRTAGLGKPRAVEVFIDHLKACLSA